jgi:hypothetical protein
LIEKAWQDPDFKEALLRDPRATIERELATSVPENVEIRVVEEGPKLLYVVLPVNPYPSSELRSDEDLESVAGGVGVGRQVAKKGVPAGAIESRLGGDQALSTHQRVALARDLFHF